MRRALLLAAMVVACNHPARERLRHEPTAAERRAYDDWRRPDLVIAALGLRPGDVVADVGAGAGYLTSRLADAVGPSGRVVATDVDPVPLALIPTGPNVETRLVAADRPGLEPTRYRVILLAEVDHLLGDRAAYLRALVPALAPGGQLAVENRLPYRAAVKEAAAAAGLDVVREVDAIPGQFVLLLAPHVTVGAAP